MKYTVRKSVIDVLGMLWMPDVLGATTYEPQFGDVGNMRDDAGKITRESVSLWLDSHAGDFSGVTDFYASIEDGGDTVEIPWADEDNEVTFNGCMYPEDD